MQNKTKKMITIRQIASANRKPKRQEEWLKALGLNKMHKTRQLEDNAIVRGLIAKAPHLVEIVSEDKS